MTHSPAITGLFYAVSSMQVAEPAHLTPPSGAHLWVLLLLSWPWVQPFAPSPLSNVTPWLLSWACLALVMLNVRHLSTTAVAQSWAIAALISSVIGLVQFFGQAEALSPAVHVPAYLGDAVGNLRQRNQQATLLSMGLLAVCWWRSRGLATVHTAWMLALLSTGLAATASRTGLLQILFLGAWCLIHHRAHRARQALWLVVVSLGIYLLASLVLPWCLQQMTGHGTANALTRMGTHEGCAARSTLWSNVGYLIAQQPLTGWGWDQLRYAHYITDYPGTRFCDILGNAHNLPLHIAFVWGLPVAALIMLAITLWVWRAQPWRHAGADRQLAWGVLGVIALHSALEYPLWYGPFQVAIVLSLWLMGGHIWSAMRSHRGVRTVAVLLLGALSVVAFDYQQVRQIYLPAAQRWAPWRDQPLEIAQRSWFFENTALFAEVTITPLRQDNARWMLEASQQALHSSPEPRVIEKLLASAQWLGETELLALHTARYQAAYPEPYARWAFSQREKP